MLRCNLCKSAAESLRPSFNEWTELRAILGGFEAAADCVFDSRVFAASTFSSAGLCSSCAAATTADGVTPFSKKRRLFSIALFLSSIREFWATSASSFVALASVTLTEVAESSRGARVSLPGAGRCNLGGALPSTAPPILPERALMGDRLVMLRGENRWISGIPEMR